MTQRDNFYEKLKKKIGPLYGMFQLLPEKGLKRYAERLSMSIIQLKEYMVDTHTVPITNESEALFKELLDKAFKIYKKQHPEKFRRK